MEKIILLKESEYTKLQFAADMNNSEIEKRAQELYEKRGIYGIDLSLNCQDDYHNTFAFTASSYVKDWNGQFPMSEKDKRMLVKFVNGRALRMMEKTFGRQISNINIWNKRLRWLRNWKMKFIGLTIFGWLAAVALTIITLIKS